QHKSSCYTDMRKALELAPVRVNEKPSTLLTVFAQWLPSVAEQSHGDELAAGPFSDRPSIHEARRPSTATDKSFLGELNCVV
ncbi:MAG: hypothetical protein ACYSW0_19550, partial [Planctomycetota bacterium]